MHVLVWLGKSVAAENGVDYSSFCTQQQEHTANGQTVPFSLAILGSKLGWIFGVDVR